MNILVAIDFSDITPKLLRQVVKMSSALSAEVVLMHIAEPNPDHIAYDFDPASVYAIDPNEIRDSIAERFHQERKQLQEHAEDLRQRGVECKALMIQGQTVDSLVKEAERMNADFIMAGTHSKGLLSQVLLGSTSEDLVKNSTIPVYLVPA
jgi:nucleotide-binding universal stress UspA family protein